jgi:hypothetical protein
MTKREAEELLAIADTITIQNGNVTYRLVDLVDHIISLTFAKQNEAILLHREALLTVVGAMHRRVHELTKLNADLADIASQCLGMAKNNISNNVSDLELQKELLDKHLEIIKKAKGVI